MTMHSGKVDARHTPMLTAIPQSDIIQQLLHTDDVTKYITAMNFRDDQQAFDFAECIYKCRRHHLIQEEERYWLKGLALCAIKGDRARMVSQTIMGVAVPEFYSEKAHGPRDKNDGNK